jgi:prephenate dehydratase
VAFHGPLTAIKAVHDIDEHSKYFIENDQDKNTYTFHELKEIVENLEMNYTRFQKYLTEVGFVSSNAD